MRKVLCSALRLTFPMVFSDVVTISFNICPCRSDWILVTQVQDASFYWGMMIQLKTFLTTSVFRVLQILFHLNSEVILRRNYIVEDKLASWHLSCPDQTIWPTSKKELPVAYEGCSNCSERMNQHRSRASSYRRSSGLGWISTQLNSLGLPKAGLKESWLWFHASISVVLVYSSARLHVVYCEHIASLEHDVVQYSFILFPRIVGGTAYNRRYHLLVLLAPPGILLW